jgi:hypothetical protein
MHRRLIGGLALAGSWLLATAAGISVAGLQTESGRSVLSRAILDVANNAINGSVTASAIGGSFLAGLRLMDVRVLGDDGVLFADIPEVQVGYGLRDLLGGRVVLGKLRLTSPRIDLVQPRGRPMNVEEIFGSGGGGDEDPDSAVTSTGHGSLIAFRDVEITDAEITIRTPVDSNRASGRDVEDGVGGLMWVRRFSNFNAALPYVRISSPDPDEKGVRFDVASINALISHPAIELIGARGTVEVRNDSVLLDLAEVNLPASTAAVYGAIDLHGEGEQYDLDVRAHGVATDQIRSLVDELPAGMSGSGRFLVRSLPNAVEFSGSDVTFDGLGGGGSASGNLSMLVGPGPDWAFRNTGLDLDNLDLEYVRAFFDTLPVAGRVTGRFEADGPREAMDLGLDIVLRDSLLPEWPISVIDARGIVSLGVPGDLVFRDYAILHADFDLATVQRILTDVELDGRLSGSGVMNGPWLELEFDGDLTHFDNPVFVTEASGVVRIDARGDTLGVWSDLMFESLDLDGIRTSYPSIRIGGTFSGRIVTDGYLDSLFVDADVAGPSGAVFLEGYVSPLSVRRAAYEMDLRVSRLNLAALHPRLPETVLFGRSQGTWVDDSLQGMAAQMRTALRESSLEGVSLDSVSWELAVRDSTLVFESLRASGRGVDVYADGGLGIGAAQDSTISGSFKTDSLGVLEPFLARLVGALPDERVLGARRPSGSVHAYLEVLGSTADYRATVDVTGRRVDRGSVFADSIYARGTWTSATREVQLETSLGSLELGRWAFADMEVVLGGTTDSLEWYARTRFGADGWGAAIAAGHLAASYGKWTVPIDSMALQLESGQWFVDLPAAFEFSESGIDFLNNTVRRRGAAGRVTLDGRIPFEGAGSLAASIEALPAEDLWMLLQREYRDVRGDVDGNFSLYGTAQEPTMTLYVGLRQGIFGDFQAPQVLGEFHYENRRVDGEVRLLRTGEEILNVDVELPVDLALTDVETRRLPGEISIRAAADGVDLSFMDAVNPLIRETGGLLFADVGITGTWEHPELAGHLSIEDGTVLYPALGVRHEHLNGSFLMSGDTIRIDSLLVESGDGTAEVLGFMRLEELTKPDLSVQIEVEEFHGVSVRDFIFVTASGTAELNGPLFGATLTGEGTVTHGILYFSDLIEKEIIDIEDTLLAMEGLVDPTLIRQQGLGVEFENRFLDSLRVDSLRLQMASDVWLRSSEANIQLLGAIMINKELDEYRFNGTLQTPRGNYELSPGPSLVQLLATRDFDVTRGEVTYFGTPDLNAALDIEARHRVRSVRGDDIMVFVHIGGTLYEPELNFSSDILPPIPGPEILSYLFLGAPSFHALAGGSGAENGRLVQQGLTQFLGAVSGQLENLAISDLSIPLDYLQIRPQMGNTGQLTAEIAAGKRLGDKWFLTVSPRLCARAHNEALYEMVGASVEYRLSRDLLFSLSGDPVRSCAVARSHALRLKYQLGADIFWEKRY